MRTIGWRVVGDWGESSMWTWEYARRHPHPGGWTLAEWLHNWGKQVRDPEFCEVVLRKE